MKPQETSDMFLTDIWYFGGLSSQIKPEALVAKKIANLPLVLGRTKEGVLFALKDICPHRGIPLSYGKLLKNGHLECCYHGWQFSPQGDCSHIPSLTTDQHLDLSKIKVQSYPLEERQGTIWIFLGTPSKSKSTPFPDLPLPLPSRPQLSLSMVFPCPLDHAVIGLMDPAHGPFVHKSWFWRSSRSIHEKTKTFSPTPLGFQMSRHKPSKNARAYKILGGHIETEITFSLPGIRIESIKAGHHHIASITAITPQDEGNCLISHTIFWTLPWLSFIKPIIRIFARTFLRQDLLAVERQKEGLVTNPPLMLIKDADTQALWYFKIKKAYAKAVASNEFFINPLKKTTLKWRS